METVQFSNVLLPNKFFFLPGPCCTEQCRYASPARVCAKATDCSKNQTCSGLSFSCDTPEPLKNETLCDQGRRVCYSGQCSVSVCVKYGLKSCSCSGEEELCDLCCEKGGECTSASKLAEVRVWIFLSFCKNINRALVVGKDYSCHVAKEVLHNLSVAWLKIILVVRGCLWCSVTKFFSQILSNQEPDSWSPPKLICILRIVF